MVPEINCIITQHFQKSHCVQSTEFFSLRQVNKQYCSQIAKTQGHTCNRSINRILLPLPIPVLRESQTELAYEYYFSSRKAPFASQEISHHKIKSLGTFSGSDSSSPLSYVVGISCAFLWEDSSQPTLALMLTQRESCYGFFTAMKR